MTSLQIAGISIMAIWLGFILYIGFRIFFTNRIEPKALYLVLQSYGCIGKNGECKSSLFKYFYFHDKESGEIFTQATCDKCGTVYNVHDTEREAQILVKG